MDVVEFARQILSLHEENDRLRYENDRLQDFEQKYHDLLKDTLKSQSVHSSQILDLMLHDGKFTKASVDIT